MAFLDTIGDVANMVYPGVGGIIKALGGLGGFHPNPDDWQGWDQEGRSCVRWILGDGDSKENEVVNIARFIDKWGIEFLFTATSWQPFEGQKATPAKLKAKFERGNQADLGAKIAAYWQSEIDKRNGVVSPGSVTNVLNSGGAFGGQVQQNLPTDRQTGKPYNQSKSAGMNLFGWVFLIGVAITAIWGFFGGNKKRRRR